jgi:hypothetical protein
VTYRPPTPDERTRAVAALKALLAGQEPDLDALPLGLTHGVDRARRPYALLSDAPTARLHTALRAGPRFQANHNGPGWGAIAVRESPTVVIEVPHPGSDRFTARLGLDLFDALPSAALIVAGIHRRHADVAHLPDSLFHAYAQTLATTEIQLHGFAETSAPDTDAVVSPGAGNVTDLHRGLEKALTRQGFRVRHHEHLSGRTNTQGIAAAARDTPFLHLELAPVVRLEHRDRVVKAVVDAWHQQGQ